MATKKTDKEKVAKKKPAKKEGTAAETKKENNEALSSTQVIQGALAKPHQEQATAMVMQVMNDFITAKQEKSMEHFFHTIAKKWQDMTTVEKLNESFNAVISDPADWSFLKAVQPTIIKDGLSERGDWVAVGVYPTKPKKLIFDQIFINEDNEWKIAELKLFTSD